MMDSRMGEYSRVFDYQLELLRSNPGSRVIVKLDPDEPKLVFHRFYVCFDALRKGFLAGCRKVIGLDGCFFKGRTGELLCAVGRDANNQIYPLAWAYVDRETNDSWDWFCDLLFNDLKLGGGEGWVIISDQQKGLLNAVAHWAPEAEHRNCARHICANWRKKHKDKGWQKLFWGCAKAPSVMLFNLAKAYLAQATPQGAKDVMNTDPRHWSRAWFRLGSDCDSVDNNMCEYFNKWIVEARFLPIISMLEAIRCKVMVRIQENRTKSERWTGMICPNIMGKKLKKSIKESAFCHAICNGNDSFEVKYREHRFTVQLQERTCSCRYWQLSGLPCAHAIACIYTKTNKLDDYIAPCYSIEAFQRTYAYCLEPVEGMLAWPISERPKPLPPIQEKKQGRIKKARTREQHEKPRCSRVSKKGTTIRCGKCKGVGHNRTSCKAEGGSGTGTTPTGAAPTHPNSTSKAPSESNQGSSRAAPSMPNQGNSGTAREAPSQSQSSQPQPSQSQQSELHGRKRKASISGVKQHGADIGAATKVTTEAGGSATIQMRSQSSHASTSVTVNVNSGSASAHVTAHSYAPTRYKQTPRRGGKGGGFERLLFGDKRKPS